MGQTVFSNACLKFFGVFHMSCYKKVNKDEYVSEERIKQIKSTFSFLDNLLTSYMAKVVHHTLVFFFKSSWSPVPGVQMHCIIAKFEC